MENCIIDYKSRSAGIQLTLSLREKGFAVIKNSMITKQLVQGVYDDWKIFFSADDKNTYVNNETQAGYFPFLSENSQYSIVKDLKEFYHYFPLWSVLPKRLSNKTLQLSRQLNSLAMVLLTWIKRNVPHEVRQHFPISTKSMTRNVRRTMVRIAHYPPISGETQIGAERAAPHIDVSALTLLPTATTTGLQIKDAAGEWHAVPYCKGAIIVLVGEMLSHLTHGYFNTTIHRVINPCDQMKNQSRFSFSYFQHIQDNIIFSDGTTVKERLDERLKSMKSKRIRK